MRWPGWLAIAAIAFAAALAGVFLGHRLMMPAPAEGGELHAMLHEELDLDPAQHRAIEALEGRFAIRRRALELEMRADNARLADAIAGEHRAGPAVLAAVDASHHAMGALQKETLTHLFAMRALLRPDQAARFDKAVTKALTANAAADAR
ncbi:periplasmic heavy metal sensor [Sphingomonas solaris]|uniref:Periplasmic heavy metal sensor n=1 Tax=Alterirhizorhabdus solaris TaxID=2529389 RepID=A0A558R4E3_9SPHN|nr:periplasmic heavy metal sensor [Sphingomonas solaris]TVV74255.1 periplasmic heavy metal sensor [Sphingomonas solaris]